MNEGLAAAGVMTLATVTVLAGWWYFRRFRLSQPPIGVVDLGDVAFLLVMVVLMPYLYLGLPTWLVGTIFGAGTLGVLLVVLEPVVASRAVRWSLALGLIAADVALALGPGTDSTAFLAVNDLVLLASVVGVTNLWVQGGMRAFDAALLGGALTGYDLVATSIQGQMGELIERLAGLPFLPMMAWPLGDGRWLGLGLGDLLMATSFPLVLRKAYGRQAGMIAVGIALAVVAVLVVPTGLEWFEETFPVMVLLGPLMVAQYLLWSRRLGPERTMAEYLQADPPRGGAAALA